MKLHPKHLERDVVLATKEMQSRTAIRRKMIGKMTPISNHDVTRTPHDTRTDEQLIYQQTLNLGNASQKKKRRRRRRRKLTATKGEEEPWPNSDDSESKRDADGHESGSSEVKSKPLNRIKRHRTRTPQYSVPRDLEQDTLSSDSDSVSEDKSWTTPTQETDPATNKSVSVVENYNCVYTYRLKFPSSLVSFRMRLYIHLCSFSPIQFFL